MQLYPEFFCEPHKLLKINNTEPVLVALSGGADSTLLLHLLNNASKSLSFPLFAAHVNHNIRTENYGGEAARDEEFCQKLCKDLDIPLFTLNIDVPTLAKEQKTSLETAARDARYNFFSKVMTEHGIRILATAHNADDNLETQIFNLSRGCGIDGISGIPEKRDFPAVENGIIVRPILSATKAEVIDYCHANDFDFVTDSTNFEDDCTRNRIRHRIIPELCSLFGTPQRASARLSRLASADTEYLDMTASDFLEKSGGEIECLKLNSLHVAIASRVISMAYSRATGAKLEQTHIDAILRLSEIGEAHSSISLPCKTAVKIERGKLIFVSDDRKASPEDYEQVLAEGLNVVGNGDFAILLGDTAPDTDFEANGEKYIYFSSASLNIQENHTLIARNRREGDTIRNGGMTKKVKKLLCDKKIELDIRNCLPIICRDGKIIYIPLCAIADEAKTDGRTTRIFIYKKQRGTKQC